MDSAISRMPMDWKLHSYSFVGVILFIFLLFAGTFYSMVEIWWRSGTFTHGFFILPISLYMIWHRKEQLRTMTPEIDYTALVVIAMIGLVWLTAELASVVVIKQFCAIALIPLTVWFFFGRKILIALSFPLAYLFFSVPVGEFLVPKLQDITAWFSVYALESINMPVYWEGRYISIPSGDFVVAEACSGIRYLIASVALGCLYAYISYHSIYRRLAFIALSVVVPIFANALRAFGIIMIAHYSDMKLATGIDHFIYGWLFFGLVMFLLFWLGNIFRDQGAERRTEENSTKLNHNTFDRQQIIRAVSITSVILLIWPLAAWMVRSSPIQQSTELSLPRNLEDWSGPASLNFPWKPSFKRPSQEITAKYQNGDKRIFLYIAHYAQQNQDAELINSENTLYDDSWRRMGERQATVSINNGEIDIHYTQLRRGGKKLLIGHFFRIGSYNTINKLKAKLYEAENRLFRRASGSYVIAIASTYDVNEQTAKQSIEEFIQKNHSLLGI